MDFIRRPRNLTGFAGALLICAGTFILWSSASAERPRPEAIVEADVPSEPLEISDREPWNEVPAALNAGEGLPSNLAAAPVGDAEFAAKAAAAPNERISVLVHLDPQTDFVDRPTVKQFAWNNAAIVKHEYDILPNVMNIRNISRSAAQQLQNTPGVVRVEEDYEVHTFHNDSVSLIRGMQTQIAGAGLSATGAGIRACVIDSGIDSNSIMYSGRIDAPAGWDFVNNDSNPEDDNGHGSHVAGTVLGGAGITADFGCVGPESMQGVAPQATLIGVKVLNASGSGSASNIIAGINRCASPTLPGGQADVINLSLGGGQFAGTCDTDSMAIACNNAVAAGVVVVVAAGNNNFTNALSTPACASQVIAVGAVYDDTYPSCEFPTQTSFSFCTNSFCTTSCTDNSPAVDQRCCFSNRSVNLDVSAPGCIIFSDDSTVPAGNGLVGFCGTSQAAPHVAGLAALLLDVDPSLTPAQVHQTIRDGAIDLGAVGFDNLYGHGRIDVINSLQLVSGGCTSDPECSDGLFCNGVETCVSSVCQPGTPPNCADAVACTTDTCNETTDSCDHTPNNGACSDGLFCDGSETCHVTLGCQAGTAPNCADSVACTIDSCNEGTDSCDHIPDNAACSDGLFCNGNETCHVTLGCQAGAPPNCSDGVACTDDSCNEGTDSCDHGANNANCDDGQFCNGAETCHATLGCQAGSDPCPGQVCDEGTDTCANCITHDDCDDGVFCNGVEQCVSGACQGGTVVNCDDGVACTGDSCNEGTDTCDHAPNNAACDDGLFCNGAETCHVTLGCQPGSDPCGGAACDEGTDTCLSAEVWMSFIDAATVPGVGSVANEDIVARNVSTGAWSLVFDGSDVGLGGFIIDGMAVQASGDILLSFTAAGTIPGMTGGPSGSTTLDDSDVVRFVPTSLGANTAGSFVFYFDGSDVGLTTNNEDIDAIALTSDGRLIISTIGAVTATGASGQDTDLLVFNHTGLGATTTGSFAVHFDGSDVSLTDNGNEDVDAASSTPTGTILLSTIGAVGVPGVSAQNEDVLQFTPTQLGTTTSGSYAMYLDLSALGISTAEDVGSVEYVP